MDFARRNARSSARACESGLGNTASPSPVTFNATPLWASANRLRLSVAEGGSVVEPGVNSMRTVFGFAAATEGADAGGGAGAAGGAGGAGSPSPAAGGGGAAAKVGSGPDVTVAGNGGTASMPIWALWTGWAGKAFGAGGAAGAGAASTTTRFAFGSGGAAGLGFGGAAATGMGVSGFCAAAASAASRCAASRSAIRCCAATSGASGLLGTVARIGYGELAPGGGGRWSAIAPPCKSWYKSTAGLIGFSSAQPARPAAIATNTPTAACRSRSGRLPIDKETSNISR